MPSPFDNARLAATLPWEDDWVTACAFVGSTHKLVAGDRLGGLLMWDLSGPLDAKNPPKPVLKLEGHTNAITHLASTPEGLIASCSYDHTVALWDVNAPPKGKGSVILDAETRRKKAKQGGKKDAAVEAPGVDVSVDGPLKVLAGHAEWIQAMTLSRDGELLVTGDDAGEVIVWRLPSGEVVRRWKTKGWISALSISTDKRALAVAERIPLDGDRFRALGLWDVATGTRTRDLLPAFDKKQYEFASADLSPDGTLLAVGQGDDETSDPSRVFFLNTADGKKVRESKAQHQYGVRAVRFTADGKHLLSSGRDTTIRVTSVADGAQVKEIGTPRGGQFKDWMCAFSLSADGKLLAGVGSPGTELEFAL